MVFSKRLEENTNILDFRLKKFYSGILLCWKSKNKRFILLERGANKHLCVISFHYETQNVLEYFFIKFPSII